MFSTSSPARPNTVGCGSRVIKFEDGTMAIVTSSAETQIVTFRAIGNTGDPSDQVQVTMTGEQWLSIVRSLEPIS